MKLDIRTPQQFVRDQEETTKTMVRGELFKTRGLRGSKLRKALGNSKIRNQVIGLADTLCETASEIVGRS